MNTSPLSPKTLQHFLRLVDNAQHAARHSDADEHPLNDTSLDQANLSVRCARLGLIKITLDLGCFYYTLTEAGVQLARENGVQL